MAIKSAIGDRLRYIRVARYGDRGRAAIGQAAGVTGTTWAAYEERGVVPAATVVASLVNAMPDLNVLWLLTGQGEPFAGSPRVDLSGVATADLIAELNRRVTTASGQMMRVISETAALSEYLDRLAEKRNKDRRQDEEAEDEHE